ncbi:trypsin-like peptidase domain-containing protein [Streptomyces sp. NPDC058052]|uniref:trypsin-like peptidase domain-containing protein n=1 Tax=Streptomyces sp. NPDC058052 TaxID=3346316 RepID=UPI0036EEB0FF
MTASQPISPDQGTLVAGTVWISAGGEFIGSGFLAGAGVVVTAAHVVVDGAKPAADLIVHHASGEYPVPNHAVTAHPSSGGVGGFYPHPDLAILRVEDLNSHPILPLATVPPPTGTELMALGYSIAGPGDGVQPEALTLKVSGWSGPYTRLLGDGPRPGHSGSPLVNPQGMVCGVLKGSRNYKVDQGGWSVTLDDLLHVLGERPAPTRVASGPVPTDADIVDALMGFPGLSRPDNRYDLLDRMGELLGLPYSFEADERPAKRDHLSRIVHRARHFRDGTAALIAIYTAMEELAPYDGALERLREVVGRSVGGWETT